MLQDNEFDCAILEVGRISPGFLPHAEKYAHLNNPDGSAQVIWAWETSEVPLTRVVNSREFWSLKVPLSGHEGAALGSLIFYRVLSADEALIDLSNICGPLQRELASALERLMDAEREVAAHL